MRDRSLEPILEVKACSNHEKQLPEMGTTQDSFPDVPLCIVCGKAVILGVNGCPMIRKGQEMLALLGGGWEYMKHYACEMPKESSLK